jgi:excisionase family DNA binding protein
VQRWCKTRDLPAVKIGKSYRIEKKDFEEWYMAKKGEPYQGTLRF